MSQDVRGDDSADGLMYVSHDTKSFLSQVRFGCPHGRAFARPCCCWCYAAFGGGVSAAGAGCGAGGVFARDRFRRARSRRMLSTWAPTSGVLGSRATPFAMEYI